MSALFKTHTLGCKVNQYETELVREGLLRSGFQDAAAGESASLCVVNTCTVTQEGDAKSRQVIRRMARQNPHARIVVMGCYATRAPQEIAALPGVVEVVTDKRELPDVLGRFGVADLPTGITRFGNRHRAYVKVQDGCLLRCSYCIIPQVRPQMASRPQREILEEVIRLVDNGHREIVLTGIHLGHYGVDWNARKPKRDWVRLSDLVRSIVRLSGDFRVRLSSIEATEVTRELVEVMAEFSQKVCPHLHICMQSGSETVLRRMNRRWGAKRFLDRCHFVRDHLDRPALTTDAIVGFPGETDAEFEETCAAVRDCQMSKVHIFPFSPRSGTPAAEMGRQVSAEVKSQRCQHLAGIELRSRQQYYQSLLGKQLRILVESLADGPGMPVARGTSCRYAPVELASATNQLPSQGHLARADIWRLEGQHLVGSWAPRHC